MASAAGDNPGVRVPPPLFYVAAIVDRLVIARDEAYLRCRFGAEYEAFTARVRRWL